MQSPGGDSGKLIEIDGNTGTTINGFDAHSGSVNVVRKRDQNTFVTAGFDGVCRVCIVQHLFQTYNYLLDHYSSKSIKKMIITNQTN
jgi:hypothetical protein